MPNMIANYNTHMGGVDLFDQMVARYRIRIRKRKWWWCVYTWSLSASAVNAWRLMNFVKKDKMPFLDFLRHLVTEMLAVHGTARVRPGPSLVLRGPSAEAVRLDGKDHWPIFQQGKQPVCKVCNGRL